MFPNCFPYWIIDNKKIENTKWRPYGPAPGVQDMVYSSRGFLLPCCVPQNLIQIFNSMKEKIHLKRMKSLIYTLIETKPV